MATVADVIRFERGIGDSKRLFTEGPDAFKSINVQIEAVESAMMEEFGCNKAGLKALSRDAVLRAKSNRRAY